MASSAAEGLRFPVVATVFSLVMWLMGRRRAVRKSDERECRAVEIGVGSAHLLRDVGFEASGGPGGCVWRSGAYRTGVSRRDAGVRLLRDARL
jgi:hypothetical protein